MPLRPIFACMVLSRAKYLFIVLPTLLLNCSMRGKSFYPDLRAYQQQPARTLVLKRPLREISGIDYFDEGQLLAINDEEGKLYFVQSQTGKQRATHFGHKADYEDVVLAGNDIFILRSDGWLTRLSKDNFQEKETIERNFGKWHEFEALYFDSLLHSLMVICKHCGKDQDRIDAFRYDLDAHSWKEQPAFSIAWSDIRRMARDGVVECRPSAAALHPVTHQLFIVCSIGKVLLVCDRQGRLQEVHKLNPDEFQQPEGICFTPRGDMYISNEGKEGKGTILYFPYHPQ